MRQELVKAAVASAGAVPPDEPSSPGARVVAAVAALVRTLSHGHGVQWPGDLPVDLRVSLSSKDAAASVVRDVERQVKALAETDTFWQPGRVHCFLCDGSDCVHASPPDGAFVFAGYRPTGKPEWKSFVTLCLERGEDRVDQLFTDRPSIIAFASGPDELTDGLLPGFGQDSRSYRLLGQVVAGLVPVSLSLRSKTEARVAMALQVIETNAGRNRRLRVNLLGLTMEAIIEAAGDDGRGPAESLRRTIVAARERVDAIGRRARDRERRHEPRQLEAEVTSLVGRLAGDIERVFRGLSRRTEHAQDRHESGERPTSRALADARGAPDERHFFDAEKSTVVVIGKKGRAHVFSPDGQLVTSLSLQPGELERKQERRRWVVLTAPRLARFRARLDELVIESLKGQ